jgi:hypothetical protein
MKPMLQDGWMLTSLDASADSKMAETLTALASIAGTVAGGGTGAAAKSANNSASKLLNLPLGYNEATTNSVLRPGLYSFYYNRTNGVLESLKPVVFFNSVKGTTDH